MNAGIVLFNLLLIWANIIFIAVNVERNKKAIAKLDPTPTEERMEK